MKSQGRNPLFVFLGIAVAYFATARLGLLLATINNNSSPVWPATGLAMGALFIFGKRFWPAIAVGAFFANFMTSSPLLATSGIALGNTLEALGGAWLIAKVSTSRRHLEYQARTFAVILAALFPTMLSSTIGTLALAGTKAIPWDSFGNVWLTWWVGDALGTLVIAPFLKVTGRALVNQKSLSLKDLIGFVGALVLAAGISYAVFRAGVGSSAVFLVFPLLIVAVILARDIGVQSVLLVICAVSIWSTSQGHGPFGGTVTNDNLISLQLFLASLAATALMLCGYRQAGPLALPAAVLLVSWTLAGGVFYVFHQAEVQRDSRNFSRLTEDVERSIKARLTTYEDALRGGVSLHMASERVTEKEWQVYVSTLRLEERYPGISALGVVRAVSDRELPHFIKSMQRSDPTFSVKSLASQDNSQVLGDHRDHAIIALVEPREKKENGIGLDLSTENIRMSALQLARDSGEPAMTGKLSLAKSKIPGFILYVPFYLTDMPLTTVEQRRRAHVGWIHGAFASNHFFNGVLGHLGTQIEVAAFDGDVSPQTLMYSSTNDSVAADSGFERITHIHIAHQSLTLGWRRSSGFVTSHNTTNAWVGFCGALLSLMFTSLIVGLQTLNRRAEKLVGERTTELTRSQKDLQKSESRFRLVAQSANDGIIVSDGSGDIVSWNAGATKIFGYDDKEVVGKPLKIIIPERFHSMHDQDLLNIQKTGVSNLVGRPVELAGLRKDGSEFLFELSLASWNSEGKPLFCGIIRDISERKKIEKELIEAKEAALVGAKTKSEFLANMSHEIRTPINGIIGMAGFLLDSPLSPEQRGYMEALGHSADSLLTIINDILDFSKVEAGKLDLEEIDFNLKYLLEDIEKSMLVTANQKGVELRLEIPATISGFTYKGDPGRLRQILNNLISNALKFTPRGRVLIRVDEKVALDKSALTFSVEDTGIGVAPEAQTRMFQSFSQADSSTARKFGGTGLGLSISKKLVELMHGEIGMTSKEGVGSRFWFRITLAKTLGEPVIPSNALVGVRNFCNVGRVLVAEDNPINQIVAVKLLEKMGFRANAVASGVEVLAALRSIPYDMILMDCQMPEMDGYEATKIIRTDPAYAKWSRIPIIALTANAIGGDRERCLAVGMSDYLTKPVNPKDLAEVLGKWADSVSSDGSPGEASSKTSVTLDISCLDAIRAIDSKSGDALVRELCEMFLASTPTQFELISKGLRGDAFDDIRRIAHSLKSASGNLGAQRFSQLCQELEDISPKGDVGMVREKFEALVQEFDALAELFKLEISRSKAA